MELKDALRATVKTLVKTDVQKVYDAFIHPDVLTKFWLSGASDSLAVGQTIQWNYMVPGASDQVTTQELVPNKKIKVSFSNNTTTEWTFESIDSKGTIVTVINEGYTGSADEQIKMALNAVEGYTWVMADLKTLLEQGQSAGIVKDKAWLIERSMK